MIAASAFTLAASQAFAIVGGGAPTGADGVGRSIVIVTGSRGNVCTGTLIAPTVVLTAAHCTGPGLSYRVLDPHAKEPRAVQVRQAVTHPKFDMRTMLAHRATADVALLRLPAPLPGRETVTTGMPRFPVAREARFTVAGIGVTESGSDAGVGKLRIVSLAVTGQPGTLQMRLVDPLTQNRRAGLGACIGDSGAPVFEQRGNDAVLVGVVSWSTAPNNDAGCGGLTGVTPLTLYRDWILSTARSWGAEL